MKMTHLGNTYYKFENKIYTITSPSQTIKYSLEKNIKGQPVKRNNVYEKMKAGDLMLSPYAMWKLKLVNYTDTISFNDLKKYQDSLQLVGHGSGEFGG